VFAAALAAVALLPGGALGQQSEKCFLWKVTSKTPTVYVLGSMHLGHPSLYPLAKEIEDAFANSKALAVELNIEKLDQDKLKELTVKKVTYPDGESLSKSISDKTMDLLKQFCEQKKLKVENFDRLRPCGVWLALSTLTGTAPKDWSAAEGIDFHFMEKAVVADKQILELETIESSLWPADLSAELQEVMLAKLLADGLSGVTFPWADMGDAWKKGDVDAVEKIAIGDDVKRTPAYQGVIDKMYYERNVKMAEKIEGYLKGSETVFVAVGAGHLVGPKGIVPLLRGKKYEVTQVTRPAVAKEKP